MPAYRTYLIDLTGYNTYFDSDDNRWYKLTVLVERGGQILQVLTVSVDQINHFYLWLGWWTGVPWR